MTGDNGSTTTMNRRSLLKGLAGTFLMAKSFSYMEEERILAPFRDVAKAADNIIAGIDKALADVPEGKTLFVPIGEIHPRSSHKLVLQSVMQKLKERGSNFAFGVESDYDLLAEAKIPFMDNGRKNALLAADRDGENVLRLVGGQMSDFSYARVSTENIFRFCLDQKISTSFNDLSSGFDIWGDPSLDPEDPQTMLYSIFFRRPLQDRISVLEPDGIAMRNAAMAIMGAQHAKAKGVRIYIQHCGAAHVYGSQNFEYSYALSLVSAYRSMAQPSFPVLLSRDGLVLEPAAQRELAQKKGMAFDDLDNHEFEYELFDEEANDLTRKAEIYHIQRLMRRTGLELYGDEERFHETAEMARLPQEAMKEAVKIELRNMGIPVQGLEFEMP